MKATLRIPVDQMDEKVRPFLNGILGGAPAEQVAAWLAIQRPEAIVDMIDRYVRTDLSQNCMDMLHTARLDGRWTEKQVAWYVRELRA